MLEANKLYIINFKKSFLFVFISVVEPNFYSKNLLFLGKTYMKLNNKKMALLWLTKARDRLPHTEEDKQVSYFHSQIRLYRKNIFKYSCARTEPT